MDPTIIVAAIGVLGTILAAYLAARGNAKQSDDNVVISREQGAQKLLDSLTAAQDRYIGRLEAQLARCQEENEKLRRRR